MGHFDIRLTSEPENNKLAFDSGSNPVCVIEDRVIPYIRDHSNECQ
jgi:hypothetical protein